MFDKKGVTLQEDAILLDPIMRTGRRFYIAGAILLAFTLWGIYAYLTQYGTGLGEPNVPGTPIPDGGMTLMLLGVALVGIEALRRRSIT